MKFTKLYEELKFDDVFPVASKEDVSARKAKYSEMRIKEIFDDAKKTKLLDGTWHIHDDLSVTDCDLTSLKDLNVSIVDGYFECQFNQLTTLEGCPKEIKGFFNCSYNKITSLEGCPAEIHGIFWCSNNLLRSLKYGPKIVHGDFFCSNNRLTSLEGAPTVVKGYFTCYGNAISFAKDEIRRICKVTGEIDS